MNLLPDIILLKAWIMACNTGNVKLCNEFAQVITDRSNAWIKYERALANVLSDTP